MEERGSEPTDLAVPRESVMDLPIGKKLILPESGRISISGVAHPPGKKDIDHDNLSFLTERELWKSLKGLPVYADKDTDTQVGEVVCNWVDDDCQLRVRCEIYGLGAVRDLFSCKLTHIGLTVNVATHPSTKRVLSRWVAHVHLTKESLFRGNLIDPIFNTQLINSGVVLKNYCVSYHGTDVSTLEWNDGLLVHIEHYGDEGNTVSVTSKFYTSYVESCTPEGTLALPDFRMLSHIEKNGRVKFFHGMESAFIDFEMKRQSSLLYEFFLRLRYHRSDIVVERIMMWEASCQTVRRAMARWKAVMAIVASERAARSLIKEEERLEGTKSISPQKKKKKKKKASVLASVRTIPLLFSSTTVQIP